MEKKLFDKLKQKNQYNENTLRIYFENVKRLNDRKPITTLNFLEDTTKILKKLDPLSLPTKKNYLNSILCLLDENPRYEKAINDYEFMFREVFKELKEFSESHQKTQKEIENWATLQDLKTVMNEYEKLNKGIQKETSITNKELKNLQTLLILSLYLEQPPRRLEDYANMKIIKSRDEIEPNKNYLLNLSRNIKYFIIGVYKTNKIYGQRELRIPKKINSILNVFLKFNKKPFLLNNVRGEPMTANSIGKTLSNAINEHLNKKISCNMIRKIFVSEHLDIEQERKKKLIASQMGHALTTQLTYLKV